MKSKNGGKVEYTYPPIQQLPEDLRPRELFKDRGPAALSDEMLLALLLRAGGPGVNAVRLARDVLDRFGGLEGLSKLDLEELLAARVKWLGEVKGIELLAAVELGKRCAAARSAGNDEAVTHPSAVCRILVPLMGENRQEKFWALLLNTKNRLIGKPVEVARGTLNNVSVHPRDVFNKAVRVSAARVILAHNHPSGDPSPSREDRELTRRMTEAGVMIGIPVLDHVVIGGGAGFPAYVSFRESGLLND